MAFFMSILFNIHFQHIRVICKYIDQIKVDINFVQQLLNFNNICVYM